jgi:DNA-binding transcriptional LysR family regulator
MAVESVYLKTLVEVVRSGSLSRAADTLCVTQPAVSRRIKFMEEQYGHPLLDRSGPKLRPTDAGLLVYQKAETLLEIEADLVARLHLLDGKTRIAFSCTPSFGIAHLPLILKEFMLTCAETADLKFVFNTPTQILRGLTEGQFDLAVMEMCACFDLSAYVSFPLPDAETVFVSAPGLGIPSPDATVDALAKKPLFTRREGCCSRTLLESGLAGIGHDLREFRKLIVSDDLHLIVRAVLDGEGVSFLSRDILDEHVATGRVVVHHVPGFPHVRQRALVVNRSDAIEGPLAQLITALFEHFDLPSPTARVVGTGPQALAGASPAPIGAPTALTPGTACCSPTAPAPSARAPRRGSPAAPTGRPAKRRVSPRASH